MEENRALSLYNAYGLLYTIKQDIAERRDRFMSEFEKFIHSEQHCPYCGEPLESDGFADWRCEHCNLDFETSYNESEDKYELSVLAGETCVDCDGPFPDCLAECKAWRKTIDE